MGIAGIIAKNKIRSHTANEATRTMTAPCQSNHKGESMYLRYAVLILGLIFLQGCASNLVFLRYDAPLVSVERPANIKEKYGAVESLALQEGNKYFYSDSVIDAVLGFVGDDISFSIQNKTDQTIKLIWDDAGFIEPNGSLTRIMHVGVKYTDRNNSMPSSIIPRRGKLVDIATPVDRISWKDGYYSKYGSSPGGWENEGIFPWHTTTMPAESFLTANKKYVGSKFGLLLPLEIEGVKNEYIFWFEVKDVTLDTSEN